MSYLLPGTYLTDGVQLLWVVERTGNDTVIVENAATGAETVMGDNDLNGYKPVGSEKEKG
jgi:hypothetical protein